MLRKTGWLLLFLCARPLSAQMAAAKVQDTADTYARKSLPALRISGAAPVIDGILDDAVWRQAAAGTDFMQLRPHPGKPATHPTEVRFAFDDDAIYVALRMYDSSPDSIVAQLSRRDQSVYSDWVFVCLDSYYDRRTAFIFGVNPRGVKLDEIIYEDTREDASWDAVWDVATRVDSLGWTAELRIPTSQLRYSTKDSGAGATWGMNVMRRIARYEEEAFWSPLRGDESRLVSAFGDLTGLDGLKAPRRLEVVPYSMSRLIRAPGDPANPFFERNDAAVGAGADIKFGLTSDLTVTATINPDFGQVEADPSVVNLTAYETFFPEKRPFFVEGFEIFRVGIGSGNESLFYSRRIGRAPQGSAPDAAQYVDTPESATILGAAKLSGKTRGGWSLGVLSAVTSRETATFYDESSQRGQVIVEPLTHYGVARVMKDFGAGRSSVGGILTAVNRDLPDELKRLRSSAYSGGLTAWHKWNNGNYQLSGYVFGSHVTGDTSAISLTQRSSARYFQRPDNDRTRFDPARTSLSGVAAGVALMKSGGGHWRYSGSLNLRTPGFEVNDLGFMQNADHIEQTVWAGYEQYMPGKLFRQWNVNFNQWTEWTFGGERKALAGNINGSFVFHNAWDAWWSIGHQREQLSVSELRGGPAILMPGGTSFEVGFDSDERKPFNYWLTLYYFNQSDTDGRTIGIYPGTRLRLGDRAEVRFTPSLSFYREAAQFAASEDTNDGPAYVFGELRQVTTSFTTRISYTFTPNLSLQVYAEPFISAGDYRNFKQVTDPRADDFADRFVVYAPGEITHDAANNEYTVNRSGTQFTFDNPDFNFRALRGNAVLRWEYRPGSALFLVWSQGREAFSEYGDYRFRRDADRLFSAKATNVFLIKATYWLGI